MPLETKGGIIINIYEAITNVMQEGYSITKSKRNQQQGFMYRGIDDVMNTFQPLLAKYKIFVVPEVLTEYREERTTSKGAALIYSVLKVKYTFYAEDSSSISAVVIGEGMDSGDKASNKAMAVAMKYAMFQTFCIPTEEMVDPDGNTPPSSKKNENVQFICSDCGEVIKPWILPDGKTRMSVREIAQSSEKEFGRRLCLGCIKKATAIAALEAHEN